MPHHPAPGIRHVLPSDAVEDGDGWAFTVPEEGIEALLVKLIDAGYGISGLSIERPGLHEAFVRIVGPDALVDAPAQAAEVAA